MAAGEGDCSEVMFSIYKNEAKLQSDNEVIEPRPVRNLNFQLTFVRIPSSVLNPPNTSTFPALVQRAKCVL